MTSNNENATPLDELAHLLEVWGGEPARWPVRVRLRIATIEAAEPDAQRFLAQARAFDRVFDAGRDALARLAPDKARALTDRILAAAMATAPAPPASAPESAQVIALPIHSRERTEVVADYVPQLRPVRAGGMRHDNRWQAAGLMAASLLAGIYIGGSVNLGPVMQELAEAVGLSTVIDPGSAVLADDLGEEETP